MCIIGGCGGWSTQIELHPVRPQWFSQTLGVFLHKNKKKMHKLTILELGMSHLYAPETRTRNCNPCLLQSRLATRWRVIMIKGRAHFSFLLFRGYFDWCIVLLANHNSFLHPPVTYICHGTTNISEDYYDCQIITYWEEQLNCIRESGKNRSLRRTAVLYRDSIGLYSGI